MLPTRMRAGSELLIVRVPISATAGGGARNTLVSKTHRRSEHLDQHGCCGTGTSSLHCAVSMRRRWVTVAACTLKALGTFPMVSGL